MVGAVPATWVTIGVFTVAFWPALIPFHKKVIPYFLIIDGGSWLIKWWNTLLVVTGEVSGNALEEVTIFQNDVSNSTWILLILNCGLLSFTLFVPSSFAIFQTSLSKFSLRFGKSSLRSIQDQSSSARLASALKQRKRKRKRKNSSHVH